MYVNIDEIKSVGVILVFLFRTFWGCGNSRLVSLELCRSFTATVQRILVATIVFWCGVGVALAEQDQRLAVDPMSHPWSAIGRIGTAQPGHCTGFLISERHVLTAAHCLFNSREGHWHEPKSLYFWVYQRDHPATRSRISGYRKSDRFNVHADPTFETAAADWALLTLENAVGRDTGWLDLRSITTSLHWIARLDQVSLSHVSVEQSRGFTVTSGCALLGFSGKSLDLVHDCIGSPGDSGSPFLLTEDGQFYVAGIHVMNGEGPNRKFSVALSIRLFQSGSIESWPGQVPNLAGSVWASGQPPNKDRRTHPTLWAPRKIPSALPDWIASGIGDVGIGEKP